VLQFILAAPHSEGTMNINSRIALALGLVRPFSILAGSVSYSVTVNPQACHEIHLGRLTVPVGALPVYDVTSDYCRPDLRTAEEALLYATAACHGPQNTWIPAPEKYAVDLSGSRGTHRISEQQWNAAQELPRSKSSFQPFLSSAFNSLRPSGTKWMGEGAVFPWSHLSPSGARAAINSWDGFDVTYTFLDPTSFGKRDKVGGKYWVDIYEFATARPLIRVQGTFHHAEPTFLDEANWYSDRFYVMPVGRTSHGYEFNQRDLLVCDADKAERADSPPLKGRE
jgi:hypothetical protein